MDGNKLFALDNFSFSDTQTLNIGSQSTGAGAGKVTFDPLHLSFSQLDLDPKLFQMLASGTPFKEVDVLGYKVDAHYHLCVARRCPVYTVSHLKDADGRKVAYERLLLPFGADGEVTELVASLKTISPDGRFDLRNLMTRTDLVAAPAVRAVIDRGLVGGPILSAGLADESQAALRKVRHSRSTEDAPAEKNPLTLQPAGSPHPCVPRSLSPNPR